MASAKKPAQERPRLTNSHTHSSGHSEIAAVLGSEILSGVRKPGSRMPDADEMFESFGVSRVVLREVTKTLAAKGMVTCKTRVGTLVANPSSWNWLDPEVLSWRAKLGMDFAFLAQITDIRRAVEPAAAALAAQHRTREDLLRMRAALKAMHEAEGNRRDFTEADLALHIAVCMASGNPLFRSFTAVVRAALSGLLSVISLGVFANEKTHAQATARHEKIVDAIEARDSEAAADAMIRVIDQGVRHVATVRQDKAGKETRPKPGRPVNGRKNGIALWK